ncbi:MAG: leucine-rich repeat protein, partial [Clostridia bacterium]|nr:leucine-rich repeat protein [Clostridia bacterium]
MDGKHNFNIQNGILQRYSGPGGELTIPAGVTAVGRSAFEGCRTLTAIHLPETVREIGSGTFRNCVSLRSVDFPAALTKIGDAAFQGCIGLVHLELPAAVEVIGSGAFRYCRNLTSVILPAALEEVSESLFMGCTALTEIEIPQDVRRIGPHGFEDCRALHRIGLPDSLREIAGYAFVGCTALEELRLPKALRRLGPEAFRDCTSLMSAELPVNLRRLAQGTFRGCRNLTCVSLPQELHYIGVEAFAGCGRLTELHLPSNVEKVAARAFGGCLGLDRVKAEGTQTSFSASALEEAGTPVLFAPHLPLELLQKSCRMPALRGFAMAYTEGTMAYDEEVARGYLTYIRRRRKVLWKEIAMLRILLAEEMIGRDELFSRIEEAPMLGDTEISVLLLEYQHSHFSMEEIFEENRRRQELEFRRMMFGEGLSPAELRKIWGCERREDKSYVLTDYKGEDDLLILPEKIGRTAVTAVRMGAAYQGSTVTTVLIPAGITEVAISPFLDGVLLQEILVDENNPAYRSLEGMLYTGDGKCLLRCPRGYAGQVCLPEEVEEIGPEAFKDCIGVDAIRLPEGLRKIGAGAFRGCTGLTELTLPEGLIEVSAGLFQSYTALREISLPCSLRSIGTAAFGRCISL